MGTGKEVHGIGFLVPAEHWMCGLCDRILDVLGPEVLASLVLRDASNREILTLRILNKVDRCDFFAHFSFPSTYETILLNYSPRVNIRNCNRISDLILGASTAIDLRSHDAEHRFQEIFPSIFMKLRKPAQTRPIDVSIEVVQLACSEFHCRNIARIPTNIFHWLDQTRLALGELLNHVNVRLGQTERQGFYFLRSFLRHFIRPFLYPIYLLYGFWKRMQAF